MNNILLVTVDSLRADHLGCYGYDRPVSPNIDALASGGHLFRNAFSHAGATRTSFPAILSSVHPMYYGPPFSLSEERTLAAEPLQNDGFSTVGFNSNPYLAAEFGYDRGFDTLSDWENKKSLTAKFRQFVKNRLPHDSALYKSIKRIFAATERTTGIEVGSLYRPADDLTETAIKWIENHPDDGNFVWIHYMDVHHPYAPPAKHQRALGQGVTSDRQAMKLRRKFLEAPEEATDEEWKKLKDLYDAEIRFTDHEIGRLLERAQEQWDDIQVYFTADHGEEFGEHGAFGHEGTFYDELIHVPLILSGGDTGSYDEIVGLVDIAPTILDYADVSIPDNYMGYSLRSLVEDGDWPRDAVVSRVDDKVYYRDSDWKYIEYGDQMKLYDLRTDPRETNNCLEDHPEIVQDIRAALAEHPIDATATDTSADADADISDEMQDRLRALGYRE